MYSKHQNQWEEISPALYFLISPFFLKGLTRYRRPFSSFLKALYKVLSIAPKDAEKYQLNAYQFKLFLFTLKLSQNFNFHLDFIICQSPLHSNDHCSNPNDQRIEGTHNQRKNLIQGLAEKAKKEYSNTINVQHIMANPKKSGKCRQVSCISAFGTSHLKES